MDWFKVRVNHVFYDGLNRTEGWAWIKVMSLTAQLEKLPNEKQMLSVITKRELKLLTNWCETINKPLTNLLESVLKDASTLEKNREKLKNYRLNSNKKCESVTVTETGCVPDKRIREDKRGEENNIYVPKNHTLSMCMTPTAVMTYIQKIDGIDDARKKEITMAIQSCMKQDHKIWELWELVETMVKEKKKGESHVYRRKSNADQTVDAVNNYLESIGQGGNFGQVGGGCHIEGDIPKRISVGSMDTGN